MLLNNKWIWSYKPTIVYKPQTAADWMSDYKQVIPRSFETIEEFLGIYDHLPKLPQLDQGNIYAIFKEGIEPTWEDPQNELGYSIIFYPNKNKEDDFILQLYHFSLLLLVGANSTFESELNGCTFERKTAGNKIVFWMRKNTNMETKKEIIQNILTDLEIGKDEMIFVEDTNVRLDWNDPKFQAYKVAVRCISHKKRATESPTKTRTHQHQHPQQSRNKTQAHHRNTTTTNRRTHHNHQTRHDNVSRHPNIPK